MARLFSRQITIIRLPRQRRSTGETWDPRSQAGNQDGRHRAPQSRSWGGACAVPRNGSRVIDESGPRALDGRPDLDLGKFSRLASGPRRAVKIACLAPPETLR